MVHLKYEPKRFGQQKFLLHLQFLPPLIITATPSSVLQDLAFGTNYVYVKVLKVPGKVYADQTGPFTVT